MPPISPLKYRFSLIKQALSWKGEFIYEVLVWHKNKLPLQGIEVSWKRDKDYIIGYIRIDGETFMTQARTAQEFVEMVNDTIYAAYEVPPLYSQQLGGCYRLTPSKEEFERLNNAAVKRSSISFDMSPVTT